jgi:ATP-binding cassette subfamily A (ABC1) protein 3
MVFTEAALVLSLSAGTSQDNQFVFIITNKKMVLLKKVYLVMWKNLIIRKRHWILTLIEILIPVVLFIVVAAIRSNVNSTDEFRPTQYFKSMSEDSIMEESLFALLDTSLLMYAPDNDFTGKMMKVVSAALKKRGK